MQQVEIRLKMELNLLRSSLQGTLVRAKYLSKRGQGLVQTVSKHHIKELVFSSLVIVAKTCIDIRPDSPER